MNPYEDELTEKLAEMSFEEIMKLRLEFDSLKNDELLDSFEDKTEKIIDHFNAHPWHPIVENSAIESMKDFVLEEGPDRNTLVRHVPRELPIKES